MYPPQVSIILPTRNRLETIRRTVNRVLAQTFGSWELVISDNASDEDGKVAFLKDLAASDPRVKLHLQEVNIGLHANWRFCIEQAAGRYFTAVTDDDWWGEDAFLAGLLSLHDGTTGTVFPNMCIHHVDTGEVIENALSEVYSGGTGRHRMCEMLVRDGRGVVMIGLIDMSVVPKNEVINVIDNDLVYNIETVGMNRIARAYPMVFCEWVSYHHTAYSGNFCRSFESLRIDQDRGVVAFQLLDELRGATRLDEGFRPALEAQWEVAVSYCRQIASRDDYNRKAQQLSGDAKEKVQSLRREIRELRAATSTLSGAVQTWWRRRKAGRRS